jgi:branched-chain amino acid transport system permease protein
MLIDQMTPRPARAVLPMLEVGLLLVAALAPLALPDYLTVVATRIVILALFAISFDLVWGYAGIMSFGQALFFGGAGYVAAILARDHGVTSAFIVLPLGLVVGLTLALLLGGFLLLGRHPTSMIFVALGTLTGSYAAERLARGWYFLGGQNGIPSIPQLAVGPWPVAEGATFYYLALGILVVVYLLCRLLVRSQFGLALAGLRENEQRIAFFGYRVQHLKAIIFAIGGAVAGLAGSLYTFHEGFAWPNMIGVLVSTQVVLYVLFGGSGTLIGAVIGTVVIESLSVWLSNSYQDIWPIILGVLLLLVIMYRPAGLVSLLSSEGERVGRFGRPRRAFRPSKEIDDAPA